MLLCKHPAKRVRNGGHGHYQQRKGGACQAFARSTASCRLSRVVQYQGGVACTLRAKSAVWRLLQYAHFKVCMQALLHLRKGVSPEFGPDISPLKLKIDESLPDILHVKITDAEGKRWQVPRSLLADTASEIAGAPAAHTATHIYNGDNKLNHLT